MLTVRHMERLWDERKYARLLKELIEMRVEAIVATDLAEKACMAAAAIALIRLDELNQPCVPLASKFIRSLIAQQERDGGWGDAMTTALALAALTLSHGAGETIDRGMAYLAQLQQEAGTWPRIPMRRMPEDAVVSAFVLLQLGDNRQFRECVRYDAAIAWFESHDCRRDPAAHALWSQARLRSLSLPSTRGQLQLVN